MHVHMRDTFQFIYCISDFDLIILYYTENTT